MTRVLSEGFEMQDLVGTTGLHTLATSIKRSGSCSLKLDGGVWYLTIPVADLSELYFRCGMYYVTNAVTAAFHVEWRHGTTILGSLVVDMKSPNLTSLKVGTTEVDAGVYATAQSTWHLLEVHVKIDDAAGVLEFKLDGTVDGTFSGDTKPGADTVIDNIRIYNTRLGLGSYTTSYVDDIGLNDTAGAVDNSWCGDGRIIVLKPNGDTATLDLTPSEAGTHYTLVDDIPADGDATYVEGSVDDEEDMYDLEACGLGDVIITRIWTESRSKDTASSGKSVALITLASGGAEVSGGDVVLSGSYITKVKGAEELVNPVDAAAWEVADIDALQAGIRTRP